ncbi:MAG: insulinase family protein, partial [Prevotellaceae bacterium]|nr:insulinase family protein [Prevotellaceae bacterium]
FLTSPRANKRAFSNLVQDSRMEERTFFKENSSIADALLGRVANGDSSSYLCRMTAGELKKQSGEALVALFREVQRSQLDIVYTGQLADSVVEAMVHNYVPVGQVSRPWRYIEHKMLTYNEPLVYVFNNPKARQTIISTYQSVPAMRTPAERSRFKMWANYFGGGMSSVLFQDIREFRALAYSAQGRTWLTDLKLNPDSPCAFVTSLGTQSAKSMRALGVLDSIFTDMPLRPANVDATRQQIINSVNNNYPSFRDMGSYVANQQLYGYTEDADKYLIESLPAMGMADVSAFYGQYIQKAPRVTIIVGNKANLDMKQVSRLGRIIEVTGKDVYRTR